MADAFYPQRRPGGASGTPGRTPCGTPAGRGALSVTQAASAAFCACSAAVASAWICTDEK